VRTSSGRVRFLGAFQFEAAGDAAERPEPFASRSVTLSTRGSTCRTIQPSATVHAEDGEGIVAAAEADPDDDLSRDARRQPRDECMRRLL
jgi:hypothetical protein